MKPVLIAGITLVHIALISYGIAIFSQGRTMTVSRRVLTFLTVGVLFDVSATICMIISSGHILTLHGIIGYSSLAGMLADTILSYRFANRNGFATAISLSFRRWSRNAYIYWVIAYITGAVLVMTR
jgi:hypothetical protein